MNRKAVALCAAVILSVGIWWAFGRGKARAADQTEPAVARNAVELTVYSEDFGLVHETRPVSLTVGDNKIPVTEVSHKQIDKHTVRKEIELTLHNDKNAPVDLRVVQSLGGNWKIVNESHKHINLDAYQTQWTVPLPAGSKTKLAYTVDLRY